MMPTMPPGGRRKLTFSKITRSPYDLPRFDGLDDQIAQPRAGRDLDFEFVRRSSNLLGDHLFVGVDAGLALRLPGLGRHADPLKLAGERLLAGRLLLLFDFEPLRFLLQPRGVVAFARNAAAVVEFENPAGDVVEEVAIVGHGDDRAVVVGQMPFEPGDALGVEMVRRFVEQQQVGLLEQQLAERDAALLAAGELRDVGVAGRQIHRVHRDFDLAIEFPGVAVVDLVLHDRLAVHQLFHRVGVGHLAELVAELLELLEQGPRPGDRFFDVAADVLVGVELRLLREQADGEAFGELRLAVELLVEPRHDPQQRALAGAVAAQDADLGAGVERKPDLFEDFALANLLVECGDLIDVFLPMRTDCSFVWECGVRNWRQNCRGRDRCLRTGAGQERPRRSELSGYNQLTPCGRPQHESNRYAISPSFEVGRRREIDGVTASLARASRMLRRRRRVRFADDPSRALRGEGSLAGAA